MTEFKYLRRLSEGVYELDHRLTPEVRAMLCAMASRMPTGGIEARYAEIVEALAVERYAAVREASLDLGCQPIPDTWDDAKADPEFPRDSLASIVAWCEDRLCEYPIPERVQGFFDQFVANYGHACYDDETEVLTRIGDSIQWMRWEGAIQAWEQGKRVEAAAWEPETDTVFFEEPSVWIAKSYSGPMYRVKTERGTVDLTVTPDHRMCVRKREYCGTGRDDARYAWSGWHGVLAKELEGKTTFRYKRGASKFGQTRPLTNEHDPWGLSERDLFGFGQLCGFFIGDGHAENKQASYLSFHIRKDREVGFLDQLESRLGLRVLHHKGDKHHVCLDGARDWTRRWFYTDDGEKQLPSWVFHAPELFVRGLWDGLLKSDGSRVTDDSWLLANTSRQVIDGVQILGTLWGAPTSIRDREGRDGRKPGWVAFVSGSRNLEPVVNRNSKDDGWVDYEGNVYCATVSTGFLVVRRNHCTAVSGNSIMELTGSPSIYTEGISWWGAYLLFDAPLCSGQEFSTRAVRHKDWPMARECCELVPWDEAMAAEYDARIQAAETIVEVEDAKVLKHLTELGGGEMRPDRHLKRLHDGWLDLFAWEVDAWKAKLSDPAVREELGIADKEPFRPALDRARWAIPGTIATGCAHTGHLRERSRAIRDGISMARNCAAPVVMETWEAIRDGYREALPGMADLGLREALYDPSQDRLPGHLWVSRADPGPEVEVQLAVVGDERELRDVGPTRRDIGAKVYVDPYWNAYAQVRISFRCSMAVSRDWHRHRTAYPWRLNVVMAESPDGPSDSLVLHRAYEPQTESSADECRHLFAASTDAFMEHLEDDDVYRAMLCLPLGAEVKMDATMGLRDAIYMLELRSQVMGANFEYKAQAAEALRQLCHAVANIEGLGDEVLSLLGLEPPAPT